jgi:hypothetical protein
LSSTKPISAFIGRVERAILPEEQQGVSPKIGPRADERSS